MFPVQPRTNVSVLYKIVEHVILLMEEFAKIVDMDFTQLKINAFLA